MTARRQEAPGRRRSKAGPATGGGDRGSGGCEQRRGCGHGQECHPIAVPAHRGGDPAGRGGRAGHGGLDPRAGLSRYVLERVVARIHPARGVPLPGCPADRLCRRDGRRDRPDRRRAGDAEAASARRSGPTSATGPAAGTGRLDPVDPAGPRRGRGRLERLAAADASPAGAGVPPGPGRAERRDAGARAAAPGADAPAAEPVPGRPVGPVFGVAPARDRRVERARRAVLSLAVRRPDRRLEARVGVPGPADPGRHLGDRRRHPGEDARPPGGVDLSPRCPDRVRRPQRVPGAVLVAAGAGRVLRR